MDPFAESNELERVDMGPRVSIVIPCFNAADYVGDAIRSALGQTWAPVEVIVVDDGSTDASLDVIRSFGERIRAFTGPNAGGCAARNRGLREARGEWIQFLDADDVLLPTCVEEKMRVSRSEGDVVCCAPGTLAIPSDGVLEQGAAFWHQPRWELDYMLAAGTPQTSCPLHRREDLEAVGGFRVGLPRAQEWDLHLRLAIMRGLAYTSTGSIGVLIRPVPTSVSRGAGVKMSQTNAEALWELVPLMRARGLMNPAREALVAQRLIALAKKVWDAGLEREATDLALKAQSLSPEWYRTAYQTKTGAWGARLMGFELYERGRSWIRRGLGKARQA